MLSVSQDAIARDKPQDRSDGKSPGAESSTSEPKGQELVYAARISLDRMQMQVEDNLVNLSPGMAVTVEVKTGSRTVLTYLLSPSLRYKQEELTGDVGIERQAGPLPRDRTSCGAGCAAD